MVQLSIRSPRTSKVAKLRSGLSPAINYQDLMSTPAANISKINVKMDNRAEKGKELESKRNGSKMSQYGWAASSQHSKGSNETFIDKTRNIGSNKKLRPAPLSSS